MGAERLTRAAILAYRAAVHGLETPAARLTECGVLEVGVQDTPPGTVAHRALRARLSPDVDADPDSEAELSLVHSLRGVLHWHRSEDVGMLTAALRPDDAGDLLPSAHGPYFSELAPAGVPVDLALDEVADAMRQVMGDGATRSKGELSTCVTALVSEPLRPWCEGCGVHHVHDGLFRMATLPAGLTLRPTGGGPAHFLPPGESPTSPTSRRAEASCCGGTSVCAASQPIRP